MRFIRRFTAILVAAAALTIPASARALELQQVGTFSSPVFMTSPPGDPRLFVVERAGRIQVIHDGVVTQFLDIHMLTTTDGERGLLSMAFDPNYATNGLFYVDYTGDGPNSGGSLGDIHVDEFRVGSDRNLADPATRRTVMVISHSSASNHNGGQLQFGQDGLLYVSVGEAGNGANAQTLANPLGKILRIDPHGAGPGAHGVPASNPFVGTAGGVPEIWSLGLRNPFRFSFDRLTGDLIIADVGAGSFEEVDFSATASGLARGANFGWPTCEGFTGPNCGGFPFTAPVFAYPHTDPGGDHPFGCAIIGGYVYRGTQIPELAGRYVYTDLCSGELRSIQLGLPLASADRSEGVPLLNSPHSFGEDASCELYVTDGNAVDKIVGSGSSAAPACQSKTMALEPMTLEPMTLKLGAKKQPLRKKLKFFATASADSTLVARGKAVKETAKVLAANQKTTVKVKLKRAKRKRLQKRLDEKGNAKVTVKATAKDQSGATASDQIKVKLR
jgi:glucose/arabinose dehydrogenase